MPLAKCKSIIVAISTKKSEEGSYPAHTETLGEVPLPTNLMVTRTNICHAMRVGRDLIKRN